MEKLKGFTCLTDPSVGLSGTEREERKPDDAGVKNEDHRSVLPPQDVADQHSVKTKKPEHVEKETEEDDEHDEEEVKVKQHSGLAALKQVTK